MLRWFRLAICLTLLTSSWFTSPLIAAVPIANQAGSQNEELTQGMQKAQTLLSQQDFVAAEKLLRPLQKQFVDKPGPAYLLGYSLQGLQRYEEAREMYDQSKASPQLKVNALYNIACTFALQKKNDEALEALDEAVQAGFTNFGQMQADSDFDNIKDDVRFKKLIPPWLGDDEIFVEPAKIIAQWTGEAAGDQFGWTSRRAGDLDGDDVMDIVVTAPTYQQGAGKVYVYSGASRKLIHSWVGKPGEGLGNSATGIGDVNGDGVVDVIAGAPASDGKGSAYIYSGKDASVIHSILGDTPGGKLGYEVGECGDIDGDGTPDFLIGEMAGNGAEKQSGRLIVCSGKDAKQILHLDGERSGDGFGNAAAVVGLGAGEFLIAVGAPNAGPSNRGRVYVYHIDDAQAKLRFTIEGDAQSANLGQMFISFPADVDRDGTPDVYASDFGDSTKAKGGGKVVVHSGASGKELIVIHGTVAGEGLGTSPSDAGDVDGDGIGDLIIGAWQNPEGAASGGKAYLYSLADGRAKLVRTLTCKQSGDTFGFDACGIGDIDGDGLTDLMITSAWSNKLGPKTGRVLVVAGQ